MNMHEFKNIDNVLGSQAMVCNHVEAIYTYYTASCF